MATTDVVRARIDKTLKQHAAAVLASMGLTPSDAYRMLMFRIAKEKKLPFEPLIPNAKTIAAMQAARRGNTASTGSIDDLFDELNADD
jgi:DNA-damage-inducible protein J